MTNKNLLQAMGRIDPALIADASPDATQKKTANKTWVKWASIAACLCLIVGVAFRIAVGFVPSQATDIYRNGNLIEITDESELPAKYDGELLAFNLGFESYEFYYSSDGVAENTNDWYSLLASKRDANGYILLHCMFDAASKQNSTQDWKVDSVFTPDATQKTTINGVEIEIAQHENSLAYKYWHYAIFEYDGVVYDIRVQSNDANYVFDILNKFLPSEKDNQ